MSRISQHIERIDEGTIKGQPNWKAVLTVDEILALRTFWRTKRDFRRMQSNALAAQEDPDAIALRLAREYAEAASDNLNEFDRAYRLWKEEAECTTQQGE